MVDRAAVEASLAYIDERHARLLRVRVGLDDGHQKTPAQAAAVLGIALDDYRAAEQAAFLAVRHGGRV